jgi:uncharacterized membrane protein (TIGR02234 family)
MAAASRAGRQYALVLVLGAVGAGLVLLSVRQGWARVVIPPASPIPGTVVTVRGQDLVPLAGALGVVCLAGLAAVVATRRLARRLVGALLALSGAVTAVMAGMHLTAAAVLAAAGHGTVGSQAGAVTAGGGGPGVPPGTGAVPPLTAAGHVVMVSFPWRGLAVLGALAVLAAGALVAWRGAGWPVMSSRYDRPGRMEQGAGADPATLWESLSKGLDPTEFGGPGR